MSLLRKVLTSYPKVNFGVNSKLKYYEGLLRLWPEMEKGNANPYGYYDFARAFSAQANVFFLFLLFFANILS